MNTIRHRLAKSLLPCLLVALTPGLTLHAQQDDSSPLDPARTTDILQATDRATEACKTEIATYCDDVTPGESRVLACLHAYKDRVSERCSRSLGNWRGPDIARDFRTQRIYPALEDREIGEPNLTDDGERVIWPYRLPFMAQQVVDLGFELPNPYGIALVPAAIRQDLVLDQLAIGVGGPPDRNIDFVEFGTPFVENTALQLKLDAWLFPFLSVFTTIGVFDGDATIPLKFEGADLFPNLCEITPNVPICQQTFSAIAKPSYEGKNIALGINVAMGWDRFFVAVPMTYAWTDVDIIDTTAEALNITPRIGMTGDMGERGTIAVFLGATYLRAEVDIEGSVDISTPGGPDGDITPLAFRIRQRNKDRWNSLLGFNWDWNKNWSVMAEAGFGGSRENFIAGVTYRW